MQIHAVPPRAFSAALPQRASGEPADTFTPSEDLERLRKLDFRMGLQTQTYFEAEFSPAPEIEKMRRAVGAGPVPDDYARALAGLAHSCGVRERARLSPGYRAREPVEQDRAWARLCLQALRGWADRGQLQLRHRGQPVAKDADLLKLAAGGRPAVRNGVVEFWSPPPEPPPRIAALRDEVLSGLTPQEHVPAPGVERLKAMEPLEASLVIGALLDRFDLVSSEDDLDRVRKLVKEPALEAALQPHLERLARVGSEAQARGRLSWNFMEGRHKVQMLEELVKRYPEVTGGDFFQRELEPFLVCDEMNTAAAATELARTRPDWTRMALDRLTRDPDRKLLDQQHYLMQHALVEGHWKPDAAQQDWLTRRLEMPPDQSVFRYEGPAEQFRHHLKTARLASEQDPATVSQGVRDRLLERLLSDPSDKLSEGLYSSPNGVDAYRLMANANELLFHPPGGRIEKLVAELDGPRGEAALAILAGTELGPELRAQLAERLEPVMRREPTVDRRDLDVVGRIAEQFRPERMAALPPREAMQLAYRTAPERGFNPPPVDRAVESVVQRYDGPPLELPEGPLQDFTPEQLADLELNEKLTRGRPEQRSRLMSRIPRELESQDPLLQGVLRRLRKAGVEDALRQLRENRELTTAQRLDYLQTARSSREAWQALRDGLDNPVAERLKKDAELEAALKHLGDSREGWQRFNRLLDMTGEKVPEAMHASRALERALSQGKSENEAWKEALKGWIYEDGGAGEPGVVVGTEGDYLRVGAVRVPIKKPEGGPAPGPKDGR